MAKTKTRLLADKRYPEFLERYQTDPLRFAVEVCGMSPSLDQIELFNAMAAPDAKVSVVSGTSTGKTAAFGRIALWSLLCHPFALYEGKVEIGSNTYIGAPNLAQVADGCWKEMTDAKIAIGNGPHAWLCQYFNITKTRVYVAGFEEQWFIGQVALRPGQSVSIAGKHRYWQTIILDEAAGISDEHFKVIEGTQTQPGNRTLMASQGVSATGRFYESHHKLSHRNGGSWYSLRFNSENSPFATTKWLWERLMEAGGRTAIEYMIRVLGLFPDLTDRFLLGRAEIERRIAPDAKRCIGDDEPYGNMIIIDVGAGVFRDKTVVTHARVIGYGNRIDEDARRVDVMEIPICSNSLDWQQIAGRVKEYTRLMSNVTYLVDVGGQGIEFARKLEQMGLANVIKVNWGKPCFKKKNQERFFNLRAQCSVNAAEAVKDGRITFTESKHNKQMLEEGCKIPYFFDEKARYHILPKEQMKEEGIPSPDIWDTICMAFLELANYIVSDDYDGTGTATGKGSIEDVRKEAEDAFAGA